MLQLLGKRINVLLLVAASLCSYGQDYHWTQSNILRAMLNPAENGLDSNIDISAVYRNQWSSLIAPFQTSAINVNTSFNNFGVGLTVIDDLAGSAGWHRTNVQAIASYQIKLNNTIIRAGIGLGMDQKAFDNTNTIFPDQIGPDLTISSGGEQLNTSFATIDNSLGLYLIQPILNTNLHFSVTNNHLLQSNDQSFIGTTGSEGDMLSIFATVPLEISDKVKIKPYTGYQYQNAINLLLLGTTAHYSVKGNELYGGLGYRLGDAANAQFGVVYGNLKAGISYDYNVGSLSQNASPTGAIEFTAGYQYIKPKKEVEEPIVVKEEVVISKKQYGTQVYNWLISDADSIKPLNAQVTLLNISDSLPMLSSDSYNKLELERALDPCKIYSLKVSKPGYFSKEKVYKTECDSFLNSNSTDTILLTKIEVNKTYALKNIYYEFDDAELLPTSRTELINLAQFLRENEGVRIELSSHTDNKGGEIYNWELSKARAENCVKFLTSIGINPDRLVAKGYGETQPIAKNKKADGSDNPEGRALNRRTEFKIIEIK